MRGSRADVGVATKALDFETRGALGERRREGEGGAPWASAARRPTARIRAGRSMAGVGVWRRSTRVHPQPLALAQVRRRKTCRSNSPDHVFAIWMFDRPCFGVRPPEGRSLAVRLPGRHQVDVQLAVLTDGWGSGCCVATGGCPAAGVQV